MNCLRGIWLCLRRCRKGYIESLKWSFIIFIFLLWLCILYYVFIYYFSELEEGSNIYDLLLASNKFSSVLNDCTSAPNFKNANPGPSFNGGILGFFVALAMVIALCFLGCLIYSVTFYTFAGLIAFSILITFATWKFIVFGAKYITENKIAGRWYLEKELENNVWRDFITDYIDKECMNNTKLCTGLNKDLTKIVVNYLSHCPPLTGYDKKIDEGGENNIDNASNDKCSCCDKIMDSICFILLSFINLFIITVTSLLFLYIIYYLELYFKPPQT